MSRYRQTMLEALKQVREATQKPYVSMSSGGQYNVLDKDGKTAYSTRDQRLAQDYLKKNYDNLKEVSDHEISMARGELEAIADKATQLAGALQGKSDEGNPLEAWVQSKITKAKDYINSVSDYLMYNPDMKQNEETELEEGISVKAYKNAINPSKKGLQINKTGGMSGTIFIKDKKELNDLMTKLTQATKLYNIKEELEEGFSSSLKQKAKEIAKKFANNMTKAVDEIEKLAKGLSDEPEVYKTIKQYNEEIEVDEKISDIFKANKEGESIDDIAKRLKLSPSMVKKLIGEAKDEEEKKEEPKKEEDNKEGEIQSLKDQIAMLKQKLENEKNKAIKPEPNPETGEVPLTIGIAHAEFKKEKEKKEVKEDISEKAMTDREKRLQRAKDMIKYYDAQKKAALKGKNKDLAKKMLKNDTEIKEVSDKLKLKVLKKKIKQYKDKVFKKTMSTVKSPLFADKEIEEALEIKEFTSQMIDRLKKSFSTAPKKISPEQANKLSKHLDRIDLAISCPLVIVFLSKGGSSFIDFLACAIPIA